MKPLTPFWSLIVSTFRKSFSPKFRWIYAGLGGLAIAGQFIMQSTSSMPIPVIILFVIVSAIFILLYRAFVYKVNFNTLTNQNISIGKTVSHFFVVLFLTGLITALGLLLFIIPGLIFLVWFSFAGIIAVVEGKGLSALKESKALVVDRFWPVAWRLLIISLLANIPRVWLGPFWTITTPYFSLLTVALYLDLKMSIDKR